MDGTDGEYSARASPPNTAASGDGEASQVAEQAKKKEREEEEREKWLLVRKTLLQSPKLAAAVAEIGEVDWTKSRISSLKRVLETCSSFHGGPKGELWVEITCAITCHMGPSHEYLELISEHQDSLWTTCSLVTVTTLSELSLERRDEFSNSGIPQLSVSVSSSSTAVPHQAYGSIDLIEPTGKGRQYILPC